MNNKERILFEKFRNVLTKEDIQNLIKNFNDKFGEKNNSIAMLIINAVKYLGYEEGEENENSFAREIDEKYYKEDDIEYSLYNSKKNNQYWCDIFFDYLYIETFGYKRGRELLNQAKSHKSGAGVSMSYEYIKKIRRKEKPKIGYQVFFKGLKHTGVVCGVDDRYVYIIEGNTMPQTNEITNNGLGVCLRKYPLNSEMIYGYGVPKFKDEEKISLEEENEITNIISNLYKKITQHLNYIEPPYKEIGEERIFGKSYLMYSFKYLENKAKRVRDYLLYTSKKIKEKGV